MPTQQKISRNLRTGFHQRLKEVTRPAHSRLEAYLPLLNNGLTVTEYRRLLRSFYGFYATLESSMDACRAPGLTSRLGLPQKSWWLLDDLLSLGESHQAIGALPLCQDLPTMAC